MSDTFIRLECTRNGSHKFYELRVIPVDGGFAVEGLSGAIGQRGTRREVTAHNVPLAEWEANDRLEAFAQKKISRSGYERVNGALPKPPPNVYSYRILPGVGGLRSALAPLKVIATSSPEVAAALKEFATVPSGAAGSWNRLVGEHTSDATFAVALALCKRGVAELRFGNDMWTAVERDSLANDIANSPCYSLVVALGLVEKQISDYAAAIGGEASALVL